MQFNFAEIIAEQNANLKGMDNFAFKMARTQLVPADYLGNTILPNMPKSTYYVKGSSMRIYPTELGLVPMDTPLPPMGAMTSEQFFENTTKIGGAMNFPEATLRDLQEWANAYFAQVASTEGLAAAQAGVKERLVESVIGMSSLMLKAQWDTMERLKWQALAKGVITWTYGKIALNVQYNIPTVNVKNYTSTDSFYNTASKFWTAIKYIYTVLEGGFTLVTNYNSWIDMLNNPVNNVTVNIDQQLGNGLSVKEISYVNEDKVNPQQRDRRERQRIIVYNKSGTVIDKNGDLIALPFIEDGDWIAVGAAKPEGFELLQGSTPDPNNEYELGYNHIAPTVEGGQSAIWQRVFTPQDKPYQLQGETASNFLPVIINPNRVVQIHTAMSS